jgi:AAA+ superfamily predicted ATPase
MESSTEFDDVTSFPDPSAQNRFNALIGLNDVKDHIIKEARLLLNPKLLDEWSKKHHQVSIGLLRHFRNRAPLFIFGGDVGTGKSSLAESFGDAVARLEKMELLLYRLSLSSRGTGAVGEMTKLLTSAFSEVRDAARKGGLHKGKPSRAVILFIDEADALAQSREIEQMHHEDRAGVNALIRGIDNLTVEHLPALVVMCTNRLGAIDPAVRRRAAAVFEFERPNEEQRFAVLEQGLAGLGFNKAQISDLAKETGPNSKRTYGCTYSDLVRRFLPSLLLDAFPDEAIKFSRVSDIVKTFDPTPPFQTEDTRTSRS